MITFAGRVITTDTLQSLPPVMNERRLQRTVWSPTRLPVMKPLAIWLPPIPYDLVSLSTSQCFTTRSSMLPRGILSLLTLVHNIGLMYMHMMSFSYIMLGPVSSEYWYST